MSLRPVASAREAFARAVRALSPYADEVVFVGGWVHALLLARASASTRPVYTDDVDVTIPRRLLQGGRQTLVELAIAAGFEVDPLSELEGAPVRLTIEGPQGTIIDLDIITESDTPRVPVSIEGQPDLAAQGYPGQQFLLDHTQWIEVDRRIHPILDPPIRIKIPTVGVYVLHKGLSSGTRTVDSKAAKDLVYLLEILRHPILGNQARVEIRQLEASDSALLARWREILSNASSSSAFVREIAAQLILGGHATDSEADTVATVKATLRRYAEGPISLADA